MPIADRLRGSRQEVRFLALFLALLLASFTFIAWTPINDHLIVPFTAGVARAGGFLLDLCGQHVQMSGTVIRNARFAVNIENGCNGVETMLIFFSAVLAFPATWKARGIGLLLGLVAIQVINLVRVVALFLTGVYLPRFFANSHTVVWQTIVILCGVLLWILWAQRFVAQRQPQPQR